MNYQRRITFDSGSGLQRALPAGAKQDEWITVAKGAQIRVPEEKKNRGRVL